MQAKSILIIQVSRIGDTLLSTPTIRAIASAFPQAKITFLGHPKRVEILRNLPFIHHVGAITKHSVFFRGRGFGKCYDLAFVFGYDLPLVKYALRVAHRVVAFRQEDAAVNTRLHHAAEAPAFKSRHAVMMQYALVEGLGIPLAGRHLSYGVTEEEAAWAENELKLRLGVPLPKPLIGLQVASFPTKGYRDWPIERFTELCERIQQSYPNAHFLIFGGKLEKARTRFLHAHLAGCSTHYAGSLTLRQTAALMARLDLYIGVDTGPTHIMGALQRPMVAMYHPYSPSRLLAPLDHPCLFVIDHPRVEDNCGPDTSMAEISVETIWTQVQKALGHHEGCI
jgi:heptosyltransferase-3